MPKDIFAGSTLKLSATVRRGTPSESAPTFVILKNGKEVKREKGKVGGGWKLGSTATYDYPAPEEFDQDKDSYELEVQVEAEGKKYPATDYFTVWARTIKVKTLDKQAAVFGGFQFLAQGGGGGEVWKTREDGTAECQARKPARVVIAAEPPYFLVEWTKEKGTEREAKVELRFQAGFFAPRPPEDGKPLRQVVNLKSAKSGDELGQDGQGQKLAITVGAQEDREASGEENGTKVAREGDKIFVQVTLERQTKRTPPSPVLEQVKGLAEEKEGTVHKGHVEVGKDGTATFLLDLGPGGGDLATIEIGAIEGECDEKLTVRNWRRLYYQATHPKGTAVPDMARIEASLAKVFIEYKKYKTVEVDSDDAPDAGVSWFPGDWMDEPGKQLLNVGDYNKAHYHAKFEDDEAPVGVHVMCCHVQFDANAASCEKEFTGIELEETDTLAWEDGTEVVGKHLWAGPGAFPKSLKTGADGLLSGSWAEVGGAAKGAIGMDDLWYRSGENQGWITVRLPEEAQDLTDDGKKVKLEVKVFVAKGPYLGESDGKQGWLQLAVIKQAATTFNDVMAHELGHTINQVVKSPPPGLAAGDHGRRYTGNGHQGPHCADGMSDDNYNGGAGKKGSTYEGNFKSKAECKCIMYGENSSKGSKSSGSFCARCSPFLIAEDLSDLHS